MITNNFNPKQLLEKQFCNLLSIFTFITVLFLQHSLQAQDPERFRAEVNSLSNINYVQDSIPNVILFTGSASIRLWKDIPSYFPGKKIINTGFGGSKVADLQYYAERLIFKYSPIQIFIYSGENDIEARGCPGTIFKNAKTLVSTIRIKYPEAEIVFISIKPSPARWETRAEQKEFNQQLKQFALQTANVKFIDIWDKMLDENNIPKKEYYLDDGLYMSKAGYDVWASEIRKIIK